MATTYIELTLRELLQIALGNPEISSIHLSLLQSFFDILLKKLDSRTERVKIVGKLSTCMQEVLRESRISPYPFDCAKVQILSEKFSKVELLKNRVSALENTLMAHFQQIQDDEGIKTTHYSASNFEKFAQSCETFCICPEDENALACKLVTNPHFIVHLIENAISPLLSEMDNRRRRLSELHAKFADLRDRLNKALVELNENYKRCITIEKLRQDFENDEIILESTTSEIHTMLLAKLDKTELTFIKRRLNEQLRSIDTEWQKLQTLLNKGIEVKKDIGPNQCISCLGPIHCPREPVKPKPLKMCADEKSSEARKETKHSKIKSCAKVLKHSVQQPPKTV